MYRCHVVVLCVLCCGLSAVAPSTGAQESYPSRPIRVVVPTAPGGNLDLATRDLMREMATVIGQSVVVENRPGASLLVGAQYVAKSAPDGYTLLAMSNTFATAPHLLSTAGYDPIKDFEGVGQMTISPLMLVVAGSSPVTSIHGLVALARERPGEVSYGSAGIGSTSHMAPAMLFLQAGVTALHVPYKGNAPALIDVGAGRVTFTIAAISDVAERVKAGQFRALGMATLKRSPLMPGVPAIAEAGYPGYELVAFAGLAAPAGTPREVRVRLHAALAKSMTPSVRERWAANGVEIAGSESADQFTAFIRQETARYGKLVRDLGIKPE